MKFLGFNKVLCLSPHPDDVEYSMSGTIIKYEDTHFDIVTCQKMSEIFDEYYDKYKKDLINITQTEGRINPKLWGYSSPDKKKK